MISDITTVGVEIHHYRNGSDIYDCPAWNCGVGTLRALAKRHIVVLDEEKKVCQLIQGTAEGITDGY